MVDMRSGSLKLVIALFTREYAALLNAKLHFLDHPEPKNSYHVALTLSISIFQVVC